jgi:glycosyltransferase involved in cell wall biosynthesis
MLISVIITTYNRPDALDCVLQGLALQHDKHFEVLIADDGSTAETRTVIEKKWPFPISHCWHEDEGFRAARIRNLAALKAQGDYLIFIDGDCVPRPNFIRSHREAAESGKFVAGRRVLLNAILTTAVTSEEKKIATWSFWQWIMARLRGQCNRVLPLLNITLPRKNCAQEWPGAKTCNLAIWRQDFIRIAGLDEQFTGWGHEDSDLVIRLLRSGIMRKQAANAATVLHLWHKENDRQQQAENWQRLLRVLEGDAILPNNSAILEQKCIP